jgi:hypothetical protein
MAELINAKCPNCGATLELPKKLDRAFYMHCGGKIIIAKDEVHYHRTKPAIACPICKGFGGWKCGDIDSKDYKYIKDKNQIELLNKDQGFFFLNNKKGLWSPKIHAAPCKGDGKCRVLGSSFKGNLSIWLKEQERKTNTPIEHSSIGISLFNLCNNGICARCNGTGKVKKNFFQSTCEICGGTGKCRYCKGTGVCSICNGKGKYECRECNGTGFKVYQGE